MSSSSRWKMTSLSCWIKTGARRSPAANCCFQKPPVRCVNCRIRWKRQVTNCRLTCCASRMRPWRMTICILSIVWCSICKVSSIVLSAGDSNLSTCGLATIATYTNLSVLLSIWIKTASLLSGYVSRYKPILMNRGRWLTLMPIVCWICVTKRWRCATKKWPGSFRQI